MQTNAQFFKANSPYIIITLGIVLYALFGTNLKNVFSGKHEFESEAEFKNWLSDKTFTSIGTEHKKITRAGTLAMPVGNLTIRFHGSNLSIYNCNNVNYDAYQYEESYIVSYKGCDDEYYKLVIPKSGKPYMLSDAYDTSSLDKNYGTDPETRSIRTLDILASRKETVGNEMTVVGE